MTVTLDVRPPPRIAHAAPPITVSLPVHGWGRPLPLPNHNP